MERLVKMLMGPAVVLVGLDMTKSQDLYIQKKTRPSKIEF